MGFLHAIVFTICETLVQLKCFHRNLTGFQLQYKPLKVSKDLSGSRWALFGETISVNDLHCFASVNELG